MSHLALDLSKRSCGWALWSEGDAMPLYGNWALGSEYSTRGQPFINLHVKMNELHGISPFETVTYELPLNLGMGSAATNEETLFTLIGLAMHVESYCAAKRIRRVHSVHQATWRKHFLGRMPSGKKSADLKQMAMERCRQIGFSPQSHDAAEACGILDYALHNAGITTPWQQRAVFGVHGG
jgi:hypothetical protein